MAEACADQMDSNPDLTGLPGLPEDPTASYVRPKAGTEPSLATQLPPDQAPSSMWAVSVIADTTPPASSAEDDEPPKAASAYHLVKVIGRGGMGEVWEAVQVSMDRTVAVKRIRGERIREGIDDPDQIARRKFEFRQEALIAGRLEHPNIVPVHDLGVDENGAPLLAMKLVKGQPWNELLSQDFTILPVTDFLFKHLPVLTAVSQAVAFAHSRGIVHRDIKPSQVMVGAYGEVMLMDWGLSLFVGGGTQMTSSSEEAIPRGLATRESASSPSGTPALMAPEQTEETAINIGPWTDVYLLGGTLYYLLTRTFPHDAPTSAAALEKARRGFVDHPQQRRPDREVPSDLADLAMRALDANYETRISNALELVAGIQDYLSGASRRRESIDLTERAAQKAGEARGDYSQLSECLSMVSRALSLWGGNPRVPELNDRILGEYARAALAGRDLKLARLQAERLENTTARDTLLDEIRRAEERAAAMAGQRRLALRAVAALVAIVLVGGGAFTVSLVNANRQVREQRDRGEDVMAYMLEDLSGSLRRFGKLELMKGVAHKSLDYYGSLSDKDISDIGLRRRALAFRQIAQVLKDEGLINEAIDANDEALRITQTLRAKHPDEPVFLQDIVLSDVIYGEAYRALGDQKKALEHFRHGRDIAMGLEKLKERDPEWLSDQVVCRNGIGGILQDQLDIEGATKEFQECLRLSQEIYTLDPKSGSAINRLSLSYKRLGETQEMRGELVPAQESYEKGRDLLQALVDQDKENPENRMNLSILESFVGDILFKRGMDQEALASFHRTLDIRKSLVSENPENMSWRRELAVMYNKIAFLYYNLSQWKEAEEYSIPYLDGFKKLVERDPDNAEWKRELAAAHNAMGAIYLQTDRLEDAIKSFTESVQMSEAVIAGSPDNQSMMNDLSFTLSNLSYLQRQQGDMDAAAETLARSAELRARLSELDPQNPEWWKGVADSYIDQATLEVDRNNIPKAKEFFQEGIAIFEKAIAMNPENAEFAEKSRNMRGLYRQMLERAGDWAAAAVVQQQLMDEQAGFAKRIPTLKNDKLVESDYEWLGKILFWGGKVDEAVAAFGKAREIHESLAKTKDGSSSPGSFVPSFDITMASFLVQYGRYEAARSELDSFIKELDTVPVTVLSKDEQEAARARIQIVQAELMLAQENADEARKLAADSRARLASFVQADEAGKTDPNDLVWEARISMVLGERDPARSALLDYLNHFGPQNVAFFIALKNSTLSEEEIRETVRAGENGSLGAP